VTKRPRIRAAFCILVIPDAVKRRSGTQCFRDEAEALVFGFLADGNGDAPE